MSTVLNVLVIGHSHAYRLGKFADASGLFANFERLRYKCKITFLGLRGATVSSFRTAEVMARTRHQSPHIVLVLLGGNDICSRSSFSPQLVGSGLCLLATELLAIGVRQVVFAKSSGGINGVIVASGKEQKGQLRWTRCWKRNVTVVLVSFTGALSRCGQARRRYSARTKWIIMMLEISAYIEV